MRFNGRKCKMIKISNLMKVYKPKKGVPVYAINDVSLDLGDKGLVFILGKSGSGKSTLLNLIGGLDKYDRGDIIIKGKSTEKFSQSNFDSYRNTYVGFVFQEYNMLDELNVGANIALAIELQGRKATNEEINEILETLDLAGYGKRRINELSGGQKQRIAIARALVKKPEIILADEPTGALDSETGKQLFNTLKKLSEEKLVIVVSHDRETAETYGDRIIELSDGKIIKDVTKVATSVINDEFEQATKFNNENDLLVKEGYELTLEDLALINEHLKQNESLNIIKTNVMGDAKGKAEFAPTESNLTNDKIYEDFKMVKSKLPAKMAAKMGASNLTHKKIRLAITIVLSVAAFTLFAIADSLAAYKKVDVITNSIIDGNVDYLAINKSVEVLREYSNNNTYVEKRGFKLREEDLTYVQSELKMELKPIFSEGSGEEHSSLYDNNFYAHEYNSFYKNIISGFTYLSLEEIANLGFSLEGNLPVNDNEIVVTDYTYQIFKEWGYNAYLNKIFNKDNPPTAADFQITTKADLIGKKILIYSRDSEEQTYYVSGVLDTNFDTSRYESLKLPDEQNSYTLESEFARILNFSYHTLGIISQNHYDTWVKNSNKYLRLGGTFSYYLKKQWEDYEEHRSFEKVYKLGNYERGQYTFFNESKTKLNEDEVILSYETFMRFFSKNIIYNEEEMDFSNLFWVYSNEALEQYVSSNYLEAEELYDLTRTTGPYPSDYEFSSEEKIIVYRDYLRQQTNEGKYINEYGSKSFSDIKIDVWNEKMVNALRENFYDTDTNLYISEFYNKEKPEPRTIVGIFLPYEEDYREGNSLIVSDIEFDEIWERSDTGSYRFFLAPMPKSKMEIFDLTSFSILKHHDNTFYTIQNKITPTLDAANDLVESLAPIFLYIGIGLAAFAALMLTNFISTSVAHKKREIGILRALGARSNDVFKIFANESVIIALINFALASLISFIVVYYINKGLREQIGLQITLFAFSIRQVLLVLGISLVVALGASFFPVRSIARKKPVDAIKNN